MPSRSGRTAHPETTAVVVTCGTTAYLRRTLQGIADQTHTPTRVVIVNVWRSGRDVGTGDDIQSIVTEIGLDAMTRVRVLASPESTNFGDAVRRGLELNTAAQQRADRLHETRTGEIPVIRDDTSPGWLWLLHDDSAPHPEALDHLLRTGESGPSIAVVGAKQRDWEQPDRLLEVGIRATSSARRFNPIEPDEIDQGQYDYLDDVLAVGLAGAIVRRDAWKASGGPDPALGPFGDGLELSRRLRLAGFRVVVEPRAVVFHARASYLGIRSHGSGGSGDATPDLARSYGSRRKAQLYNWVVAVPLWKLPFLLAFLLILTPARAAARFIGKDMTRARAELAAGGAVLSRPDLWLAARRRIRRSSRVSASQLVSLEADSADIRKARREQRRVEADARRAYGAPSELEMRELAQIDSRRRIVASVVAFGAVSVTAFGLFQFLASTALIGGGVLPDSGRLAEVWATATSAWIPQGDGHPGPADPILTVLSVPLITGLSFSTVLKWLLLLAVPAAAMTSWAAAGTATRSTSLRALAAVVWAANPLTLVAVTEGRVGAVLAHIAAPLVLAYTARAMGLRRRDQVLSGLTDATDREPSDDASPPRPSQSDQRHPSLGEAALAALAFVVVAAGSPPLLIAGSLLLVLAMIVSRFRSTIWFIPLPALVLYGPWLVEVLATRTWWALLASPGVPLSDDPAPAWAVLLGMPQILASDSLVTILLLVPGGVALVLAFLALFRGTGRARAVRTGWAIAVVGLALALLAPYVTVAYTSQDVPVAGWGGHGVTLMSLGLLMSAICGADGVKGLLGSRSFGVRQVLIAAATSVVAVAALVGPVAWTLALNENMLVKDARVPVTPALSQQLASGPSQARTFALIPTESELRAEVWRSDGPQMSETSMIVSAKAVDATEPDTAADSLASAVAAASVGGHDGVAEILAQHAIGVVLVPHESDPDLRSARDELIAALATVPGIVYVNENESGSIYRVITDDPASAASDVARVHVFAGDEFAGSLEMNAAVEPSSGSLTVRIAERSDPGWIATVDGQRVASVDDSWAQAFLLPATGGELSIEYEPVLHSLWQWAQAIVIGLTLLLALPVRRRREVHQ